VRCAPTSFERTHGRRPEVSERLAYRRLSELPTHARRLHTNLPLGILKHEPVAIQAKHHAKAAADLVQVVPASQLGCSKSGSERSPGPTREAVDSLMRFAVRRSLGQLLSTARHGPKGCHPELGFEGAPRGEELLMVPGWCVNAKSLWVE
jgi:hypothetical protein